MVIASATRELNNATVSEIAEQVPDKLGTFSPTVTKHQTQCPRCETRMIMGYDEPQCLNCGYADYSYTRITARDPNNLFSAATRDVLRYAGEFTSLNGKLAHVKLIRIRNRLLHAVKCPFCDKTMEQSSLSGKRPEVREQRYKCMNGHRVSLIPGKNGMMGWR